MVNKLKYFYVLISLMLVFTIISAEENNKQPLQELFLIETVYP